MFSVVARKACCITILTMARWKDLKVPPLQKVSTKEMGLAQFPRNLGLADSAGGSSHVIIDIFMIVGGVWS